MGEIHKKSLEGVKLEGCLKSYAPIVAFFFPGWFMIYMWCSQTDAAVKSAVLKVFIC